MPTLDIKAEDFIRGESQTDDLSNGGFSPDSVNLNLTRQRGTVYFRPAETDRGGATLLGSIIASCEDPANGGNDAYFIDDEGGFYTLDGATFTERRAVAANYTYQLGSTDLIPFNDGNFYFTSKTTIGQFDNNMGTVTEDWWSGLDTTYRHPLEVVEKELFIGDKNLIYYYDGTTSGTAFTLPAGQNVTTLRKHPDGKTLLAFTGSTADFSHTRNGTGRVYFCQPTLRGASIEGWSREVTLDSQVEGSKVNRGTVFVTWGKNFGIFDGNGLVFLHELETSGTTYNQSMTNMEDTILFRDGRNVVAYGDLGAGSVFWKPFRNLANTSDLNNIHYKGDNILLVAYDDGTAGDLVEIDYDDAGVLGAFYTNRFTFGSEVHIKRVDLLHDDTGSASTAEFSISYRDITDTENLIESVSHANVTATKTKIKTDIKTDIFQLKLTPSTKALGFKLFRVHYDPIA